MLTTFSESGEQVFHFELAPGKSYTLKAFGATCACQPHSDETRAAYARLQTAAGRLVTHFASLPAPPKDTIQLCRVYGPPDADGIPSLEMVALYTPQSDGVFTLEDMAQAILFMHPNLAVLTAEHAPAVLNQIAASPNFGDLAGVLRGLGAGWNRTVRLRDQDGNYLRNASGGYLYEYRLADEVDNVRALIARQATVRVNNDESLRDVRWRVLSGMAKRDISPGSRPTLLATPTGYHYQLQDPGPRYGISAEVVRLTDDLALTVRLHNSYIRHGSVFASFLGGDGKTELVIPDEAWMLLVEESLQEALKAWSQFSGLHLNLVFDHTHRLKYLGTLGPEQTFLGVPVSSGGAEFTFKLPGEVNSPTGSDTISKVRIICGSLGLPSNNEWDPQAAWIGIGLTALLDLVIPTLSLIATVGLPSNTLFESIARDWKFIVPTIIKIALAVEDSIVNPDQAGEDIKNFFIGLADNLLQKVLGAADVAAALGGYFGAEEVAEAIPFVGWALKAELIEATVEQLAQTVGEVIGSQRVVEFGVTISMDVAFTLRPAGKGGFPATSTSYTVTAQYTDVTGYVYSAELTDPKTDNIHFTWEKMPVGGQVRFLVAFYSKEGWLVGKGESPTIANRVTPGRGALIVPPITITELLYPLTEQTTYHHRQLLKYAGGKHHWSETAIAPGETARDLGTGEGGHRLDSLTGISLNSDHGILGYSWQASGQHLRPINNPEEPPDLPLYSFQNISFGPRPETALMFTPAGYNASPQVVYLRSTAEANDAHSGASHRGFFFLDPLADARASYHLRGVHPVTDAKLPADSPKRLFDLSNQQSWGRFRLLPTSMAVHSTGCVVAVSRGYSKLQILELPKAAVPSAQAPWSQLLSGPGIREGLLGLPELVTIAPDQTILVLEAGNSRIQAFSRGGHPVPAFPSSSTPFWIPLYSEPADSDNITYTSMSVEIKGYIYVLSYEDEGYEARQFRLDLYTPRGSHLLRQRGINVAALSVDLWRNLYTLNYQLLLGPGQRTEPSISEWIPSTPKNR
jgi:hypothetical protein